MVSINAFVDRDIIAHWSPAVAPSRDEFLYAPSCHILIKGFADGWLRFIIVDSDESLPSFARNADGYEMCLPISHFTRFDRIC